MKGKVAVRVFLGVWLLLAASPVAAQNTPGTLKWQFGTEGSVRASPALDAAGNIYVGCAHESKSKLYALTPDMEIKWPPYQTPDLAMILDSSPVISNVGTIYQAFRYKKIYAFSATGQVKWTYLAQGEINTTPAISRVHVLYFGADDQQVYAIRDRGDHCEQQWVIPVGGQVQSSPAIAEDGTIYVGCNDGKVYAFNPGDGSPKWDPPFSIGVSYIYSSPALGADGTIYLGSNHAHKVYAIRPDGTLKWEYDTGDVVPCSPVIGPDGTIYAVSDDAVHKSVLHALRPEGVENGPKWTYPFGVKVRSNPALGADGIIYVGANNGKVYAIRDAGNKGEFMWDYPTGAAVVSSPVISPDGIVYVGSNDGYIYAIYSTSRGLAPSPWPMFHHDARHTGSHQPPLYGPFHVVGQWLQHIGQMFTSAFGLRGCERQPAR